MKIAFFVPEESEKESHLRLFQRSEYLIRTAHVPADLIREQADDRFDCVILPMRLSGGTSALTTCLQLKSIDILASIPVIVLAPGKDLAILESLYGAGADIVLSPPYDVNQIFFQVCALARQKRSFDELLQSKVESSGLRLSTIAAFNSIREGILIFDLKLELIFANHSAYRMLGWDEQNLASDNGTQFIPLLQNFIDELGPKRGAAALTGRIQAKELQLLRKDGGRFRAVIRLSELDGQAGAAGYAISISDLSEIDQLANILIQSDKTRSLSLFCAALCRNMLGNHSLGTPTSPLHNLETIVEAEECKAPVAATITALLELLDLVINPNLVVKTELNEHQQVAVRPSHLLQLSGHLLLHSVDFAGPGGELRLACENSDDGCVVLSISALSRRVTPYVPNDQLSKLLQGELPVESRNSGEATLPFALIAAQNIADRYKSDVQIKNPYPHTLRLRVKLPVLKHHPPQN